MSRPATTARPERGEIDEVLDGLNLSEVLRRCLTSTVVVVNDALRITAIDSAAEHLLGVIPADIVHGPVDALPSALQSVIRESFTTGKPIRDRQIVVPSHAGAALTFRVNTTVALADNGQTGTVVAIVNDVSSVSDLEQHMRRFDRLASIGTLSASMAHEIKNALVAVKTFVELLLKEHSDAELAGIVSREMRRIDSIVSQMLRFAGPAKPTFAQLRMHELLERTLRLVQFQLDGKKVSLQCCFGASFDSVRGDHFQLEQAFINLFFNALEAMGPNGTLTIATEIIPPDAVAHKNQQPLFAVTVRDTGTGIPPENIGKLFEPFFTTKPNGTGLGLSIARRIIQEHGGTIAVESELNKGTTFGISLPALPRTLAAS